MSKHNITMKDIAEQLNVSIVTVSKALNDKEGVGEELKLKIKDVAQAMGYRPNLAAKSIKEGVHYTVGVLIPERFLENKQTFYSLFYERIASELDYQNYFSMMQRLTYVDEEALVLPRLYTERKVDGLIVLGQISKDYVNLIKGIDIPVVFLDFYDENTEMDSVISDSYSGAYQVTNYLIQNGHKDIGFVGNIYSTSSIQERYLGYYKSLLEHHIPLNFDWVIKDRNEYGMYVNFEFPDKLPTAFVCNCDEIAFRLIQYLKEIGKRVPEDISIVGFDNDIYSTIATPNITTVEVDVKKMSTVAVKIMLNKINKSNKKYDRILVKCNLVVKDSVKNIK